MKEPSLNECKRIYEAEGIEGFKKLGFDDAIIIHLLGRKVMPRECIIPALRKAGWSLDRLVAAERTFGVNEECIVFFSRQYNLLDEIDYSSMSLMEMAKYIASRV